MKEVLIFLRENAVWLHQVLIEYKLLYIDLWSIVHFWTGALLFAALSSINSKKRWKWLFIMVAGFELVEVTIFIGVLKLFMPEKLPDVFIDIIVGMAGGYLVYFVFQKLQLKQVVKENILVLLSSAALTFFWTGYYAYELNIDTNTIPKFNGTVFLFWLGVGFSILTMYRVFYKKMNNLFLATGVVATIFYVLIIPANLFITNVLGIYETAHDKNIKVFNLVDIDTHVLQFYILFPFLLVALYSWLIHFSKKVDNYNNYQHA